MIIIWRGAGGLVIIFGIVSALLMNIIGSEIFRQDNYFAGHSWIQALCLWIAGAASFVVGKYVNGKPGKPVVNKQTGETVIQKPNHHLMFIKMEYWGPIYFAIGMAVLIVGLIKR